MTVVVDASAWYLSVADVATDARAAAARTVLPRLEEHDDIVGPMILGYELAHLVHVKHRNVGGTALDREERLARLLSPLRFEPSTWAEVGRLAEAEALSAYDAAYLELAERLGATLLTEDAKLKEAASRVLGKTRAWGLREAEKAVGE